MTKLSQCNECQIGEGIHCEHYKPMDDTNCSFFKTETDQSDKQTNYGLYAVIVFIACIIGRCIGEEKTPFAYGLLLFFVAVIIYYIIAFVKKLFKPHPYMKTRNLIIGILRNLGCQPEVNKETTEIHFKYQGEHFFITIESESIITIYDTWWASIDLNDPQINNAKEAVNLTNMNATPTTLYSIHKEENRLGIHSRYKMLLTEEIPNKEEFFHSILDAFFLTQNEVKGRFSALNAEQMNVTKKQHHPIKGFTNFVNNENEEDNK